MDLSGAGEAFDVRRETTEVGRDAGQQEHLPLIIPKLHGH
jgi:hypothetical protein